MAEVIPVSSVVASLKEWVSAHLLHRKERTPAKGYIWKIESWREHPYEPTQHEGHDRSTTMAQYGGFVVCYCRDCGRHYRQTKGNLPTETYQ